jgi:hypothetical protein
VAALSVIVLVAVLTACSSHSGSSATPTAASTAGPSNAQSSSETSLTGTVSAAGKPLEGATVTLYAGGAAGATSLGQATTASTGGFAISYAAPASGIIYATADGAARVSSLRLMSVVGVLNGGGVPPKTLTTVVVNELTTVAATFALAQFISGTNVSGPAPGLENAAATAWNLTDATNGSAGAVVTDANNGNKNATLATLNTLANLVATCDSRIPLRCTELLRLTTPPGGTTPTDTTQAVQNLVKNPTLSRARLFVLSTTEPVYQPTLNTPPLQWMLALLYTQDGQYASGRIAIDAKGNVWTSNNWIPGTEKPSTVVSVFNPVGSPTLGGPISGGGMKGGAWGAAIAPDGSVWIPSFGGNAMSKYSSTGTVLSPSTGYPQVGLNHPQGVAVDQKGNVWIANNFGPESAPGQGSVVVYPKGNPAKAITITGAGINHPFAIQIDNQGRAWVDNAGLGGAKLVNTRAAILSGKASGSVTVIGPNFKPTVFSPITTTAMRWPLGLALDSHGNAWTANFFSNTATEIRPNGTVAGSFRLRGPVIPWSEAVDGSDRVWVADFGVAGVTLLCGANTSACPPGASTGSVLSPILGYRSPAIQHLTSVQIDQSGNLWLSNNWSTLHPTHGGTGLVELIGIATPICTPLLALPQKPAAGQTNGCPGS